MLGFGVVLGIRGWVRLDVSFVFLEFIVGEME